MTPFKTIKPSTLDRDAFVAAFADVYEHSPWVAETVYQAGIDETLDNIEVLHTRLSKAMLAHVGQAAAVGTPAQVRDGIAALKQHYPNGFDQ